jgi:hypothetical protein
VAADDDENDVPSERLRAVALFFGFLFNVKLTGWRRFCLSEQLVPIQPLLTANEVAMNGNGVSVAKYQWWAHLRI